MQIFPYIVQDPSIARNSDLVYGKNKGLYRMDEVGLVSGLLGLSYRQGGSATSWATVGTTSYPIVAPLIQCGAVEWTGGAAVNGGLTVTYPAAFGNHPVVFACAINDTSNWVACSVDANGGVSSFVIYWHTLDGNTKTAVRFNWIAIGPPA